MQRSPMVWDVNITHPHGNMPKTPPNLKKLLWELYYIYICILKCHSPGFISNDSPIEGTMFGCCTCERANRAEAMMFVWCAAWEPCSCEWLLLGVHKNTWGIIARWLLQKSRKPETRASFQHPSSRVDHEAVAKVAPAPSGAAAGGRQGQSGKRRSVKAAAFEERTVCSISYSWAKDREGQLKW